MRLKAEDIAKWKNLLFIEAIEGRPFSIESPMPRILKGQVQLVLFSKLEYERQFLVYWRGILICKIIAYLIDDALFVEALQ